MSLIVIPTERNNDQESAVIEHLVKFLARVRKGEIQSFAMIAASKDGGFSINKSIQERDRSTIKECLKHLEHLISLEE